MLRSCLWLISIPFAVSAMRCYKGFISKGKTNVNLNTDLSTCDNPFRDTCFTYRHKDVGTHYDCLNVTRPRYCDNQQCSDDPRLNVQICCCQYQSFCNFKQYNEQWIPERKPPTTRFPNWRRTTIAPWTPYIWTTKGTTTKQKSPVTTPVPKVMDKIKPTENLTLSNNNNSVPMLHGLSMLVVSSTIVVIIGK